MEDLYAVNVYAYMHLYVHICMYKMYIDRYMSVLQLSLKILGFLELLTFLNNPGTEKVLELWFS